MPRTRRNNTSDVQPASSSALQPASIGDSASGSPAVRNINNALQPANIVITYDEAKQRRLADDIVRSRPANRFLKKWRTQHTRSACDPPFDIEFEPILITDFDWPGYLAGRSQSEELEIIFGNAEGFTHCELRFLNVRDINAKQTGQPYRVDFICYRSDGAAIRLHPSLASDANPVIGHIEDWAFTPDAQQSQRAVAQLHSPYTTISTAAPPAEQRKLYNRFSQADQLSHRKAGLFLENIAELWQSEGTPRICDLTNDEVTFPWKAYLSGWPAGAAVNDEHDGISLISVRWLDDGLNSRAAFYVQCHDGYQTVLEPRAEPSPEKLRLIRW